MADIRYYRMVQKSYSGKPTIPASPSHDTGDWTANDIYEQELYVDETTKRLYTRVGNTIVSLSSKASFPAAIDFVDGGVTPPTEVDGDVYVLQSPFPKMTVATITWMAGTIDTVRYNITGDTDMLDSASVGDWVNIDSETDPVHNGLFQITAISPASWFKVSNPLVTDATHNDGGATGIAQITNVNWDGAKINDVVEYQSTSDTWIATTPEEGQTIINKADFKEYVFNGIDWLDMAGLYITGTPDTIMMFGPTGVGAVDSFLKQLSDSVLVRDGKYISSADQRIRVEFGNGAYYKVTTDTGAGSESTIYLDSTHAQIASVDGSLYFAPAFGILSHNTKLMMYAPAFEYTTDAGVGTDGAITMDTNAAKFTLNNSVIGLMLDKATDRFTLLNSDVTFDATAAIAKISNPTGYIEWNTSFVKVQNNTSFAVEIAAAIMMNVAVGANSWYDFDVNGLIQIGTTGSVIQVQEVPGTGGTITLSGALVTIGDGVNGIVMDQIANAGTITDSYYGVGFVYAADYSATFTNESLITKRYADTKLSKSGGTMTGSILFASSYGIDTTSSVGSDVLNIGATNADVINYGNSSTVHNFLGTAIYELQVNSYVTDKLITLNYGGGAGTGIGVGFEVNENSVITGYFKTNAARSGFDILTPAVAFKSTLSLASLTGNHIHTLPNVDGTLISSGGSYADPAWLTSLNWSKITVTPTSLAGYGITDGITSISLATPNVIFATPVTFGIAGHAATGTLTMNTQSANVVFAGPTSGGAATPTFRALVASDIPSLSSIYQPLDADLTAIAALSGSAGFLKTNGTTVWTVDTSTYLTGNQNITISGDASGSGTTAITLTVAKAAALKIAGVVGLLSFTGLAATSRTKTIRDADDTVLELGGSYTPTGTWTSMTLVTPALGTPASGVLNNCTTATQAANTNNATLASTAYADAKVSDSITDGVTTIAPAQNVVYDTFAAVLGMYRQLILSNYNITAATAANTFYLVLNANVNSLGTNTVTTSNTGATVQPAMVYIDSANFPTVMGVAPKLRIRGIVSCNDVAPTGNFTLGLYPITRPAASGGATVVAFTIGTVVTGSNGATVSTPAADSMTHIVGSDFALPANGWYAICVVTTATAAVSSYTAIQGMLEWHNG